MTFQQFQKDITFWYCSTSPDEFTEENGNYIYQSKRFKTRIEYTPETGEWRMDEGRGSTLQEAEADSYQKYELAWDR